ncbi:MAG: hypothetical protein AAFR30_15735, partial [Cyanobacteria bacterium J06628_4]
MPCQIAKLKVGTSPVTVALRRWGRYVGLLIASLCLVWGLATSVLAQTPLTWEDLQPSTNTLQNPYAHLAIEQTYDLAAFAQLQTWVADNQPGPDSLEMQEMLRLG